MFPLTETKNNAKQKSFVFSFMSMGNLCINVAPLLNVVF